MESQNQTDLPTTSPRAPNGKWRRSEHSQLHDLEGRGQMGTSGGQLSLTGREGAGTSQVSFQIDQSDNSWPPPFGRIERSVEGVVPIYVPPQ